MSQKMSDKELERRSFDAEIRRREMLREQNNPQFNPLHPDTASDFNRLHGGSLNHPDSHYPQNVQVTYGHRDKNERRKKVMQQNSGIKSEDSNYEESVQTAKRDPLRKLRPSKEYENGSKLEKAGYMAGGAYGVFASKGLMSTAYTWTGFIWCTTQLWLGILLVVALAITMYLEEMALGGASQFIMDTYLESQGVDWDFELLLYICFALVVALGYMQVIGVAIQAKALKLHSLGGSGSSFKTGAFLFCLVGYWVPILNCFPLVSLYILSIQLSPR